MKTANFVWFSVNDEGYAQVVYFYACKSKAWQASLAKFTNILYLPDFSLKNIKTYNVIEDIKLLNEKDNILGGFLPIDKCEDTSRHAFTSLMCSFKKIESLF